MSIDIKVLVGYTETICDGTVVTIVLNRRRDAKYQFLSLSEGSSTTLCFFSFSHTGLSEAVNSSYGTPVDCYSAGIVLFVTLAGSFPRFERSADGFDCVKFAPETKITPNARALISGLTHPDPNRRMTVQQALVHPWLLESSSILVPINVPSIGAALLMQPLPHFEVPPLPPCSSFSKIA